MSGDAPIRIRTATRSDIGELSELGRSAFAAAYDGTADREDIAAHVETYFGESAIASEMALDAVTYYVARLEGNPLGLVKVRPSEVPQQIDADSVIEVQQLYVATNVQRGGIGHMLMDRAVAHARTQRADGVWLSVWEHATWAVSFYTKYGFEVAGKLAFHLGSTTHTDLLMYFPLRTDT